MRVRLKMIKERDDKRADKLKEKNLTVDDLQALIREIEYDNEVVKQALTNDVMGL